MRYEVLVTRDTTESATIFVEAESKEDAAREAIDAANSGAHEWEVNIENAPSAYLGSGVDDDVTEADLAHKERIIW